jgi:hypothetical protein
MVYGIVMYDFQAERADELEAKAGEAIIVIAQSNPEWFVAKPIGRLGGPGLIPVSFVEIRDMATDTAVANPHDAVKRAGVPKVEEWKKMTAEYKNSSITLGKFEGGGPPGQQQSMEQGMERLSLQQQRNRQSQQQHTSSVSEISRFITCKFLSANRESIHSSNKIESCRRSAQRSKILLALSQHPNCMRLSLLEYPDIALQRRSTGSLLRRP